MKRFWREVAVDEDRVVRLDARPVRTPGRTPLSLPNVALAEAVAEEWRGVTGEIDPRAMPLTGLANAAIDRVTSDPATFAAGLARYAESDLLYYRAADPAALAERQAAEWDPLLAWATRRYDVHFETVAGVIHRPQPDATIARLGDAVRARGACELAALAPIVTIGGSLVAALALIERAASPDAIWRALTVDEAWQIEKWGADAEAVAALEARCREFESASRFLDLLRG